MKERETERKAGRKTEGEGRQKRQKTAQINHKAINKQSAVCWYLYLPVEITELSRSEVKLFLKYKHN